MASMPQEDEMIRLLPLECFHADTSISLCAPFPAIVNVKDRTIFKQGRIPFSQALRVLRMMSP